MMAALVMLVQVMLENGDGVVEDIGSFFFLYLRSNSFLINW